MRIHRCLQILVVPLLFFEACSTSPTASGGGNADRWEVIPSSVGSFWTYEWVDSLLGETDTVVVRVAAELDSSELGPVKVWVVEHTDGPDTMFMAMVGDTLRFHTNLIAPWDNIKFVFPLYVGAGWRGDRWSDSSWVSDYGEVSVPAGQFSHAFRVEETWALLNEWGSVTTWIVPGVGIVMENRFFRGWSVRQNYVRRLVAYEIVEA